MFKALLFSFAGLCIYFTYVSFVFIPSAMHEMQYGWRWARQNADLRWRKLDSWVETAQGNIAIPMDEQYEQRIRGVIEMVDKTSHHLRDLGQKMQHSLAEAAVASRAVSMHVGQYHGLSDDREYRVCFVIPTSSSSSSSIISSPFVRSLVDLCRGSSRLASRLAIYTPATHDDLTLRRSYQRFSLETNIILRRPVCHNDDECVELGVESAFGDGCDHVALVAPQWSMVADESDWVKQMGQMFRSRADLGVIQVLASRGQQLEQPMLMFSRIHMRIFGPVVSNAHEWVATVYGESFSASLNARLATIVLPTTKSEDEVALDKRKLPKKMEQLAETFREFLCRDKLWPRYCNQKDVEHFLRLPHHHLGKSLTRAEFERMEQAAKAGFVADLSAIQSAQRAAQQASIARHGAHVHHKKEHIARLRQLLKQYDGRELDASLDDMGVRWRVLSVLRRQLLAHPSWPQLWHMPLEDVVNVAEKELLKSQALNQLQLQVQQAFRGLAVLSPGVVDDVKDMLKEMSKVLQKDVGGSSDDPLVLLRQFKDAWPLFVEKDKSSSARHEFLIEMVKQEQKVAEGSVKRVRPCVIDGVVVPYPWYSEYADDELSSACYANKTVSPNEKCCDQEGPLCVAMFQGYGSKAMQHWVDLCRSPGWGRQSFEVAHEKMENFIPCVQQGVTVPSPWRRDRNRKETHCIAPKDIARPETCCNYHDPIERKYCVAIFDSYDQARMYKWMSECRTPYWK